MRQLLLACLLCAGLSAQISDLAVSHDGQTLLFRTTFRLQSETDLVNQGKIYRYQHGQWTRLVAAPYTSGGQPHDVWQPFLTSDPDVYGWQTYAGCAGPCFGVYFPPFGSQVQGLTLPADFPTGSLRISHNARYVI